MIWHLLAEKTASGPLQLRYRPSVVAVDVPDDDLLLLEALQERRELLFAPSSAECRTLRYRSDSVVRCLRYLLRHGVPLPLDLENGLHPLHPLQRDLSLKNPPLPGRAVKVVRHHSSKKICRGPQGEEAVSPPRVRGEQVGHFQSSGLLAAGGG